MPEPNEPADPRRRHGAAVRRRSRWPRTRRSGAKPGPDGWGCRPARMPRASSRRCGTDSATGGRTHGSAWPSSWSSPSWPACSGTRSACRAGSPRPTSTTRTTTAPAARRSTATTAPAASERRGGPRRGSGCPPRCRRAPTRCAGHRRHRVGRRRRSRRGPRPAESRGQARRRRARARCCASANPVVRPRSTVGPSATAPTTGLVNLNTATQAQLEELPGNRAGARRRHHRRARASVRLSLGERTARRPRHRREAIRRPSRARHRVIDAAPLVAVVTVVAGVLVGEQLGPSSATVALIATGIAAVVAMLTTRPTVRRVAAVAVLGLLAVALIATRDERPRRIAAHSDDPGSGGRRGARRARRRSGRRADSRHGRSSVSTRCARTADAGVDAGGRTVAVVADSAASRLALLDAGDRVGLRGWLRPLEPYDEWLRWRHAVGSTRRARPRAVRVADRAAPRRGERAAGRRAAGDVGVARDRARAGQWLPARRHPSASRPGPRRVPLRRAVAPAGGLRRERRVRARARGSGASAISAYGQVDRHRWGSWRCSAR